MDARIILGGTQPDIVNVLARSNEAAQQRINYDQQNALTATLQEQGPGILAGDQNALNALARFDPQAALGVQSSRLGMDATRQEMSFSAERMQMARDEAKRAASEQIRANADKLSKEQLAAEQQQITAALSGAGQAYQAGDRAGYDRFLAAQGLDPAEYPFEQFPMIAATYTGVLDAMKDAETVFNPKSEIEWRTATPEEAMQYGAQAGQINIKTGKFDKTPVDQSMSLESDGAGGFRMSQGPAGSVSTKPLTEGQSKDTVFVTRAEGALSVLDPIAENLANLGMRAAEYDPTGVVRGRVQSDDFQVAKTAGDEFLQAILRKDTGAAITSGEQALYGVTYLPQPGDGPAQLEYKKGARRRAVEAIKAGLPPSAIVAQEKALAASGSGTLPDANAPAPSAPIVIDGFTIEAIE